MKKFMLLGQLLHHVCILDDDHMSVQGIPTIIKACVRKEKALHAISQDTVILQPFTNAESPIKTK